VDCQVTELPLKPVQIAAHYQIKCAYDDIVQAGQITSDGVIILNKNQNIQRQRFTIMHELGHYLLGHIGGTPLYRDSTLTTAEQAADRFAVGMLMPACVLWALDIYDAKEIAKICNVSMQAAKIRAQRMQVLYKRNMFLSNPLEYQVYRQFREFINSYKKR
jgi:Zn-dependent peptidase ImmA (M78 family)